VSAVEEFCIVTARNVDRVRDRLSFEFAFMVEQGLPVAVEEGRRGDTTFFICRLEGARDDSPAPENLPELFRHHLANALSDLIVNEWEKSILRELVWSQCDGFDHGERKAVLSAATRNLDCRADGRPDLLRKVERKGRILRLVAEYLASHREMNIDGFVTFRLRDYREQLGDAVGRAVDDFLMEREYLEFISLLRYFVEGQASKLKLVHVVILPQGAFKLIDDKGEVLSNDHLAESFLEVEAEANTEDILVSALITTAPERIVLHCPVHLDRMEALDTIRTVFEDRVRTCRGCRLCREERRAASATSRTVQPKKDPDR